MRTQTDLNLRCRPTVVQHHAKRVDSKRAGARNRAQVLLDHMRGQARAGRDRLASLQQRCLHHSRHSRACSRSRKWYRLRQAPVLQSPVHAPPLPGPCSGIPCACDAFARPHCTPTRCTWASPFVLSRLLQDSALQTTIRGFGMQSALASLGTCKEDPRKNDVPQVKVCCSASADGSLIHI